MKFTGPLKSVRAGSNCMSLSWLICLSVHCSVIQLTCEQVCITAPAETDATESLVSCLVSTTVSSGLYFLRPSPPPRVQFPLQPPPSSIHVFCHHRPHSFWPSVNFSWRILRATPPALYCSFFHIVESLIWKLLTFDSRMLNFSLLRVCYHPFSHFISCCSPISIFFYPSPSPPPLLRPHWAVAASLSETAERVNKFANSCCNIYVYQDIHTQFMCSLLIISTVF